MFNDQKGNTDSKHAKSRLFDFKIDPPDKMTKVLQQIDRQRKNVVVPGKINKKIGGAVAPLYLMIKKEILIMSTSKHAKQNNCCNEH